MPDPSPLDTAKPFQNVSARVAEQISVVCPVCGERIARQTPQQIVDQVLVMPEGTRFQVLAPVVRTRKGEFADLFEKLNAQGYSRVRVDGVVHSLTDPPKLKKQEKHDIEVVVDRLTVKASAKQRLTDSVFTISRSEDCYFIIICHNFLLLKAFSFNSIIILYLSIQAVKRIFESDYNA